MPTNAEHRVKATYVPRPDCWLHEALEMRPSQIEGHGLFATRSFLAGAVIARLGGRLVSDADLERLIADPARDPGRPLVDSIAVGGGSNLVIPPGQAIHFANHSCDPNLWHIGPFVIATRRAIATGEEVTVDYATQTTNPKASIDCCCGSWACRGTVTGEDWKLGELRKRYGEHWVPAALDKIAASDTSPDSTGSPPLDVAVELRPVRELASTAASVLGELGRELDDLVPDVSFEHIGATSLPDGFTKGDVDVNLRLNQGQFDLVVAKLSERFDIAQPRNWTATYASFADDRRELPVGIQVTTRGSDADFLVKLRDLFRHDAQLRRDYNHIKSETAPGGADSYWRAKNDFLRPLIDRSSARSNRSTS